MKSNLTCPTNLNVGHAHVRSHGRTGHATLSYLSKHSFRQTLIWRLFCNVNLYYSVQAWEEILSKVVTHSQLHGCGAVSPLVLGDLTWKKKKKNNLSKSGHEKLKFKVYWLGQPIFLPFCPIHVVTFTLISNFVTDYIQKRKGEPGLFSFEYNLLPKLISK